MSYCVNCGVELDKTLSTCPLCNTPIINPKESVDLNSPTSYPKTKGIVDPVKRSDTAILLSVILIATAVASGILNLFVFQTGLWSLYIIGACILLWIFFIPVLLYSKLSIYLTILFDGIAIALYCGIVYYQFPINQWFLYLALPIIVVITFLIIIFTLVIRFFKTSILSTAILIISEIAVLTVSIELLIKNFLNVNLHITWSAVVLTTCVVIDIMLITILKRKNLRDEVRRRMHI